MGNVVSLLDRLPPDAPNYPQQQNTSITTEGSLALQPFVRPYPHDEVNSAFISTRDMLFSAPLDTVVESALDVARQGAAHPTCQMSTRYGKAAAIANAQPRGIPDFMEPPKQPSQRSEIVVTRAYLGAAATLVTAQIVELLIRH